MSVDTPRERFVTAKSRANDIADVKHGIQASARIASRSALRRLPDTDDVARMVEYLLGDGGRNITGSVQTIDAGNTA